MFNTTLIKIQDDFKIFQKVNRICFAYFAMLTISPIVIATFAYPFHYLSHNQCCIYIHISVIKCHRYYETKVLFSAVNRNEWEIFQNTFN